MHGMNGPLTPPVIWSALESVDEGFRSVFPVKRALPRSERDIPVFSMLIVCRSLSGTSHSHHNFFDLTSMIRLNLVMLANDVLVADASNFLRISQHDHNILSWKL